jgi:hypothetical protein
MRIDKLFSLTARISPPLKPSWHADCNLSEAKGGSKMKRAIKSAAAVAILTVAMVSTSHAWSVNPSYSSSSSNQQRSGRDSVSIGKNGAGRDKIDNKQRYDNSVKVSGFGRMNSHNMGANSIMISGDFAPKVGHQGPVSVGSVQGDNNNIDNSISGNFGIVGHTINTGNTTTSTNTNSGNSGDSTTSTQK